MSSYDGCFPTVVKCNKNGIDIHEFENKSHVTSDTTTFFFFLFVTGSHYAFCSLG
jgi:hypothetical protein